MAGLQPFNYGNVLAQAENIKGSQLKNQLLRQEQDPNSRKNQLLDLQLEKLKKGPTKLSRVQEIPAMPGFVGQLNPETNEWKNTKDLGDDYKDSFTLGNNRYKRDGKLLVDGGVDPKTAEDELKTNFNQAEKLRKEFVKATGPFAKINDAYTRIQASSEDPSPAGDMALIFNYMKMLDPGSVVRESEFALAAASGSMGQRIQSLVAKVVNGERLADSVRADFVNRAKRLYTKANVDYGKRKNEYSRIAESFNLDPMQIIVKQDVSELIPDDSGTQALPEGITEEDIMETMRANNMTREQVIGRVLNGR